MIGRLLRHLFAPSSARLFPPAALQRIAADDAIDAGMLVVIGGHGVLRATGFNANE